MSKITTVLQEAPDRRTNWPEMLKPYLAAPVDPLNKEILTDLLFMITRTLLPNQIAENRALMLDLYSARRATNIRVVLRYDMLREWKKGLGSSNAFVIPSDPPPAGAIPPVPLYNSERPLRPALLPNVVPTLIAAPQDGYRIKTEGEKMKHHVTALDTYLLLTDAEVEGWLDTVFLVKLCEVLVMWQWLRENNQRFEDMGVMQWEELEVDNGGMWVRDMKGQGKKDAKKGARKGEE